MAQYLQVFLCCVIISGLGTGKHYFMFGVTFIMTCVEESSYLIDASTEFLSHVRFQVSAVYVAQVIIFWAFMPFGLIGSEFSENCIVSSVNECGSGSNLSVWDEELRCMLYSG